MQPDTNQPSEPAPVGTSAAGSGPWSLGLPLGIALLAGVLAWAIGEKTHNYFKPSEKAAAEAYNFTQLNIELRSTKSQNGAMSFGALGALMGLGFGMAGGLVRGSWRWALVAGVLGFVLGAAAGALPPFGIMPWLHDRRTDDIARHDLVVPLLAHAGLWCGTGAAAGLAFAVGRYGASVSHLVRGAIGGLIGAAVGTGLFEVIGAVGFPLEETPDAFSTSPTTRFLARALVAVFAALGTLLLLQERPRGMSRSSKPLPLDEIEPATS